MPASIATWAAGFRSTGFEAGLQLGQGEVAWHQATDALDTLHTGMADDTPTPRPTSPRSAN
ncbi:hypothetical protein ACJ6WF_19105 [Streptomyces sp. MMS24-I2-30]|uniref:hypothetical protein n=1 Tax=Streptomyces sp. MMS24-I2-30 TaxID=3351564 RepID=UPI003896E948